MRILSVLDGMIANVPREIVLPLSLLPVRVACQGDLDLLGWKDEK